MNSLNQEGTVFVLIIDPSAGGSHSSTGVIHSIVELKPIGCWGSLAELLREQLGPQHEFITANRYAVQNLDRLLRYARFEGAIPSVGESVDLEPIRYLVSNTGAVEFRWSFSGMPVSVEGLSNAADAGIAPAFEGVIALAPHTAHGGDGPLVDLLGWLLDHSVDLGIGSLLTILTARFRNMGPARRARIVVLRWKARQLHHPHQLRALLDTRERWGVDALSKLLRVNWEVSRQLLRALGYTENAGHIWALGTRKKARARRARWMSDEGRDTMGAHFELHPSGKVPDDLG